MSLGPQVYQYSCFHFFSFFFFPFVLVFPLPTAKAVTKSVTGTWGLGTRGGKDVGRGDAETRGSGDAGTRGRRDSGTRGRGKQTTPDLESTIFGGQVKSSIC